jgi:phosphoketolase
MGRLGEKHAAILSSEFARVLDAPQARAAVPPAREWRTSWPMRNAYWRAANYLSVGQIHLLDNPS